MRLEELNEADIQIVHVKDQIKSKMSDQELKIIAIGILIFGAGGIWTCSKGLSYLTEDMAIHSLFCPTLGFALGLAVFVFVYISFLLVSDH